VHTALVGGEAGTYHLRQLLGAQSSRYSVR
jgi:hypothetical protein